MASPWNREDPLHVEETRVIIREINVRARTHFKVMTEMQGRFVYEDGKTPGRLLLCEFLDNSIYALQRSAFLANTIKPFPTYEPIEVHIFYSFHTNDGERVPELIAVLDRGPGMDEKALGGWAEFGTPAAERAQQGDGSILLDEYIKSLKSLPAFQADGRLGIFGKGSKSAGFYYGSQVRAVSRPVGCNETYELLLDTAKMKQAAANRADFRSPFHLMTVSDAGLDWQSATISVRGQSAGARTALRLKSELECKPLLDLYERADSYPSYSLFVISNLHKQPKRELRFSEFLTTVCELRDTYSIYCGTMARAFDQLDEKLTRSAVSSPGSEQLERLAFNFGELDITVTHHKRLGRAVRLNESNWRPPQTYSLRPDRCNSFRIEDEIQQAIVENKGLVAAYGRSPLQAIELAAPEFFCFKFEISTIRGDLLDGAEDQPAGGSLVEGRVLYLPFVDGEEQRSKVHMHKAASAFCFWKGRQMHYADSELLPFMQSALDVRRQHGLTTSQVKECASRVVLLLGLGSVKEVDETKFRLSGDLNSILQEKAAGSVGMDNFKIFKNSDQGWARGYNPAILYRDWLEDMHAKYDRQVELSKPLDDVAHTFASMTLLGRAEDKYETGDQVKLKGPRLPSAIPGGGFQLIVAAEIVHFYSELRPSAAGELKCPTCEIVYIRLPTALYGTEQMRCAPSALMSKEHGVVQDVLDKEFAKAPFNLDVKFVERECASSSEVHEGESGAASLAGGLRASGSADANRRLGSKESPLVITPNKGLPDICLKPLNDDGKVVSEWKVDGEDRLRIVQQRFFYAEGRSTSVEETAEQIVDGVRSEKEGIRLSTTQNLQLKKAGLYEFRFGLRLQCGSRAGPNDPAHRPPSTRQWPQASVFVRVQAGEIESLSCECLTSPVVLGEKVELEISFLDAASNLCPVGKKELNASLREQNERIKAAILNGQNESSDSFVSSADGLLCFPPLHGYVEINPKRGAAKQRGTLSGLGLVLGGESIDGAAPIGLLASEDAKNGKIFGRKKPTACEIKLHLQLKGTKLEGKYTLQVLSGGTMKFAVQEALPDSTERLLQFGTTHENREKLPKLVVSLTDPFGAPLGDPKQQVRIRTEPRCVGIDGAVARLDAHGVATFDNLRPQMAFGELPPSLTIYVEPPAGEEAEKLEGTLQIVPSTRPHCAELCDQEGVALEAQGASDGNGRVRVFALRAEAGSRVHGLRARVLTEAKEQVVRLDALDVECCGRSLSTEEKDAFDKDGALPTVDVPQKCTGKAHTFVFSFAQGDVKVRTELHLHAIPGAAKRWVFVRPSGEVYADETQRRSGRTGTRDSIEVRNGQPLSEILSVRLVDAFFNVVIPTSDSELHPKIRVESDRQEADTAPVLVLERRRGSDFELDAEFRSDHALMEYALTGRTRTGGTRSMSLCGMCGALSLRVEDKDELYDAAVVRLQLLAGKPHTLRLHQRDVTVLSEPQCTRAYFEKLRFTVADEARNSVRIDDLKAKSLSVANTQIAKLVLGEDGAKMHMANGDGSEWEFRDVCLIASRTDATPSGRLEHTLFCEQVVATVGSNAFPLEATPFKITTQPDNSLVVGIQAEIGHDNELVAGTKIDGFKVEAVMEDGSKQGAVECGTRMQVFIKRGGEDAIALKRTSSLYILDMHKFKNQQLCKVGTYVLSAKYTENRPQQLEQLRGCPGEKVVEATLRTLRVHAAPPSKLVATPQLPATVRVNNTDQLKVLNELKLSFLDKHGNDAKVADVEWLQGAKLSLELEPVQASNQAVGVGSGGNNGSGGINGAHAGLPCIDCSRSKRLQADLSAQREQYTLGPVFLRKNSGNADAELQVRVAIEVAPAHRDQSMERLERLPPMKVFFTDTHGRTELEKRALEKRELDRKQKEAQEKQREAEMEKLKGQYAWAQHQERQALSHMHSLCQMLLGQLDNYLVSFGKLFAWAKDNARFLRGGMPRGVNASNVAAFALPRLLPWEQRGQEHVNALVRSFGQLESLSREANGLSNVLEAEPASGAAEYDQLFAAWVHKALQSVHDLIVLARDAEPYIQHVRQPVHNMLHRLQAFGYSEKLPLSPVALSLLEQSNRAEVLGPVAKLVSVPFVGVESTAALVAVLSDVVNSRTLQTLVTRSVRGWEELRERAKAQGLQQAYWATASMRPARGNSGDRKLPMHPPPGKLVEFARKLVIPNNNLHHEDKVKLVEQLFGDTVVVEDEATAKALMRAASAPGSRVPLGRVVALDGFQASSRGIVDDRAKVLTQLAGMNAHLGVNIQQLQGLDTRDLEAVLTVLCDANSGLPKFYNSAACWLAEARRLEQKRLEMAETVRQAARSAMSADAEAAVNAVEPFALPRTSRSRKRYRE